MARKPFNEAMARKPFDEAMARKTFDEFDGIASRDQVLDKELLHLRRWYQGPPDWLQARPPTFWIRGAPGAWHQIAWHESNPGYDPRERVSDRDALASAAAELMRVRSLLRIKNNP